MRSLPSDEEMSPLTDQTRSLPRGRSAVLFHEVSSQVLIGSSERRRNFDASKLRTPEVVVTYSAPSSQEPEYTGEAAVAESSGQLYYLLVRSVSAYCIDCLLVDGGPSLEGNTAGPNTTSGRVEPVDFHTIPSFEFRSLQPLNAVLVSSSFLRHHIKDLVWIKARLVEHQSHIIQCRNLTMKNLNSIIQVCANFRNA